MRATVLLLTLLAGGPLGSMFPVQAHHAFTAEFDANQPVTLKGTITRVEWIHLHAWFHVAVKQADGTVENWRVEAGAPNALFRRGVNRDSLPVGTEVVVAVYRAKDHSLKANGRDIALADGRRLFVGSSGTGAPYDENAPPPPLKK